MKDLATSRRLNRCRQKLKGWMRTDEEMSETDKAYLERLPKQNPYGLLAMVIGGVSFTFGPAYGFIPVLSLVFCMLTYRTFDKEKEDNPWPFYIGFGLSVIGLVLYFSGYTHDLIV